MKFQNPSFKFSGTDRRTNGRTDKPKTICSPLFQSWGHNNVTKYVDFCAVTKQSGNE